jgi:Tfp pilus assembly protein PilN
MIEVNLLPEKRKRKAVRKGIPRVSLPAIPGLPKDRWILGAGALALLVVVVVGVLYFRVAGEAEELQVQIEVAQRDSIRFADVIKRAERLQSQRDSIAQRVAVLQEIDEARYVWPHILDEVGRALPDYTWLVGLQQVAALPQPLLRVRGRAATYFALTSFMENLEASPYLGSVRLVAADPVMITVGAGSQRRIYEYSVEFRYQDPPPELVQRVPLFGPSVAVPGGEGER